MKKTNQNANPLIHSSYWQYQVEQNGIDDVLFSQIFAPKLSNQTKFIYMAFIDEKKDIFKTGWSAFEDQRKLLGFLEHVYLPTLMFNWYDNQSEVFFIPVATIEDIRDALGSYMNMDKAYKEVSGLTSMLQSVKTPKELPVFIDMFEKEINIKYRDSGQITYIKIFNHIDDIRVFLNEEMPFEEVFEEEMGMTPGSFEYICENIENLPFVNRVLISQLNQKIPVTGF